jgi:hypothetical protein
MTDFYFGKLDSHYLLYLDPVEITIFELISNYNVINCNDLVFDGLDNNSIKNQRFTFSEFYDLMLNSKPIVEFDLLIDDKIQVQNIWWNDILLISNLETILSFIELINKNKTPKSISILNSLIQNPNIYFKISDNQISKTFIEPSDFIAFIKNSDRYLEKELKMI